MSNLNLEQPKPNPPIKRDSFESLEWTRRVRTTEVCKSCYCRGCRRCEYTGFVENKSIKSLFG